MSVGEDGWMRLQNGLFCPDVLAFSTLTRHLWWCTLLDPKQWDAEAGDCKLSAKEGYLVTQSRRKNSNNMKIHIGSKNNLSEKILVFLILILLAAYTVHIKWLNVPNCYLHFYFRQRCLEGWDGVWGGWKAMEEIAFLLGRAWFHYVALAGPELTMQTRLVSNSHRFTSLFLLTPGNKIEHHCDRFRC